MSQRIGTNIFRLSIRFIEENRSYNCKQIPMLNKNANVKCSSYFHSFTASDFLCLHTKIQRYQRKHYKLWSVCFFSDGFKKAEKNLSIPNNWLHFGTLNLTHLNALKAWRIFDASKMNVVFLFAFSLYSFFSFFCVQFCCSLLQQFWMIINDYRHFFFSLPNFAWISFATFQTLRFVRIQMI